MENRKCMHICARAHLNFVKNFMVFFSANTEKWDLDYLAIDITNPSLSYYEAPGLFLVDVGFCSKN